MAMKRRVSIRIEVELDADTELQLDQAVAALAGRAERAIVSHPHVSRLIHAGVVRRRR